MIASSMFNKILHTLVHAACSAMSRFAGFRSAGFSPWSAQSRSKARTTESGKRRQADSANRVMHPAFGLLPKSYNDRENAGMMPM
jgi:hypothetical protein